MVFHRETLLLVIFMGLWKFDKISKWKSFLYNVHSLTIMTIIFTFALTQFFDLLFMNLSEGDIADHIFMSLSSMIAWLKICNYFYCRSKIIKIMRMIREEPFKAENFKEEAICHQFSRKVRFISFLHNALNAVGVVFYALQSLLKSIPQKALPTKNWLPYDYSDSVIYWISSGYLLLSLLCTATSNTLYNTIFFEMMMQISMQVKILKNRLNVMMATLLNASENSIHWYDDKLQLEESYLFRNAVGYHIAILRLARDINSIFGIIILIQYSVSSILLCTSVYLISKTILFSGEFTAMLIYFMAMLVQILILCLASYHTSLEFDGIGHVFHHSDWVPLRETAKQSMKLMMINTGKPFVFSCSGILVLDMEALKNVIKLAYSVYNIL